MQLKAFAGIGPLLMLSSGFLFAVMDCMVKSLSATYSVWDIGFYRFGCGMAILVLIFGRHHNPFSCHNPKLLIYRGITGSISFVAVVWAYHLIPISTAMVLFYSYPAFAALFSALLFKERIDKELPWIVVTLCGIAVFLDLKLEGGILGQGMCLVGAAFAGVAISTVKKARETDGSVIIYLYFCLMGTITSIVPFASDPKLPAGAYEWLVVGGIIGTSIIAQLLMNEGFLYCSSFGGSLLLTSEVIFVAIWGLVFLHEAATWHFWVGGTMILGSMVALTRPRRPCQRLAP